MMRQAFNFLILAVGLAGCGTATQTPTDTRNDKEGPLPPGQGAFGNAFTWEWRKKDAPPAANAAPAAVPPVPAATNAPDANKERQEFEEWRAWQEWKRNNPK